jgi:hypothetical protein
VICRPYLKFDKISCLEMGERVGARKFPGFIENDTATGWKMAGNSSHAAGSACVHDAGILKKGPHYQDLVWISVLLGEVYLSGCRCFDTARLPHRVAAGCEL